MVLDLPGETFPTQLPVFTPVPQTSHRLGPCLWYTLLSPFVARGALSSGRSSALGLSADESGKALSLDHCFPASLENGLVSPLKQAIDEESIMCWQSVSSIALLPRGICTVGGRNSWDWRG